ncbi:sugar ABC transporter substrate-binding protein [Rhodococcus ruber]|uniref:Sugar ABC transporter substrate-binding protein n=1 Tax=Rhodococcus ruber TaxID=1830 RepID=A0ABT4MED4_9NOCA|nr:sugar ABC transporter substrate-binding protein [Rhodococcus ruber]MCZ4519343.1 sugar ABC transporter substrate-binding protein [Rhodococcus ruber]
MSVRNRPWITRAVTLTAAISLCGFAVGCTTPSTDDAKAVTSKTDCEPSTNKKVGVLFFDTAVGPDAALMQNKIKERGDALGLDLNIQQGKNDINTEIAAIRGFIAEQSAAIIVYPPDPESLAPVLNEAGQAGIPVFALNLALKNTDSLVTYVGPDNYDFGQHQVDLVKKNFPNGAKIGLLMGQMGTTAQIERTRAVEDLAAQDPRYQIVAQEPDNWDSAKSLSISRDWLTKFPVGDLDVIITQGPQAGTAVQNAIDSGRPEVKWVFGDLINDIVPMLQNGQVLGTVMQDMGLQAEEVTTAVGNWLTCNRDEVKTPNDYLPLLTVTQENVDSVEPEL